MFVTAPRARAAHRRHIAFAVIGVIALVALNAAVFLAPIDYASFAQFAYVGVFVVCFLANALVAIPIPYIPVVAHIGATAESAALVVVLGALGSVLGESVAFLVGRAEQGLVSERAIYRRIHKVARRELLAGGLLFLLAVPLNPVFDIAGLAAGAVGVRYRVFFIAVFLARLVRLALIVWLGVALGIVAARP